MENTNLVSKVEGGEVINELPIVEKNCESCGRKYKKKEPSYVSPKSASKTEADSNGKAITTAYPMHVCSDCHRTHHKEVYPDAEVPSDDAYFYDPR